MDNNSKELTVYAEFSLDADKIPEDKSVNQYFRDESAWLNESGIYLERCCLEETEYAECSEWQKYIRYLLQWAFDHSGEGFFGQSPACFDEWRDSEECDGDE